MNAKCKSILILFAFLVSLILITSINSAEIYQISNLTTNAYLTNVECEGGGVYCHLKMTENVRFYMPFDFNITTEYDWKNNSDGTISGAFWNNSGKYLGAYVFDGVDDYIGLGNTPSSLQGLQWINFSLSVWINPRTSGEGGLGTIYDNYFGDSGGFIFMLRNLSGGTVNGLQASIDFLTIDALSITSDNAVSYNAWQHFVLVFNANTKNATFYKNGVFQSLATNTLGSGTIGTDSDNDLRIGNIRAGTTRTFDGSIDELVIFSKALNSSEIAQIYQEQFPRFSSQGIHIFNQSITSVNNKLNITASMNNQRNATSDYTNISARVWDGSVWTASQNLTNGTVSVFDFLDSENSFFNLSLLYRPDMYSFFSPVIYSNLTMETWADTSYPIFTNLSVSPANNSIMAGGTASFSVNATYTNGTVILNINGTLIQASNTTSSLFNVSYTFLNSGAYIYNWTSWSNTNPFKIAYSATKYYTVFQPEIIITEINDTNPQYYTFVIESGNNDTYNISLNAKPNTNVTINITLTTNAYGLRVNPSQIVFTNESWSTPQQINVSAVIDTKNESLHRRTISHISYSQDGNFTISKNSTAYIVDYYDNSVYSNYSLLNDTHIYNSSDIGLIRTKLINMLWKTNNLPSTNPNSIIGNVSVTAYIDTAELYNLVRAEEYNMTIDGGFNTTNWLLIPNSPNSKLMIIQHGHDETLKTYGMNETIIYFLNLNYTVLASCMPMSCANTGPVAGRLDTAHDNMQPLENSTYLPIKVFLEPLTRSINYAQNSYNFSAIYMTGISGGGWTTTIYSAIDERINKSFPVAGDYPIFLRAAGDAGDYEQGSLPSSQWGSFLRYNVSYEDMYLLGITNNRTQVRTHNFVDNCCFNGLKFTFYKYFISDLSRNLGLGNVKWLSARDTTVHYLTGLARHIMSVTLENINITDSMEYYSEDYESRVWLNGTWQIYNTVGYGKSLLQGYGNGKNITTFYFSNLAPGNYTVYTTWLENSNRGTNVPFTIFNGSQNLTTVYVNQELVPSDLSYYKTNWYNLGSYYISAGELRVEVSDNANEWVISDAVYLVQEENPPDTLYPQFSNFQNSPANNSAYVQNALYNFNVTILQTNGTAGIDFNGLNYSLINSTSLSLFNKTLQNLGAGSYVYYFYAWGNGSSNLYNTTQLFEYSVSQASQSITTLLNGAGNNLTLAYPIQINASFYGNNTKMIVSIDNNIITPHQNYTYGSSHYIVNFTSISSQNYSLFARFMNFTINKASGIVNASINHTQANYTATYGNHVNNTYLNGTITIGSGNIALYLNGSLINNQTTTAFNATNLSAGYYNFTAIYEGNQNYSSDIDFYWINITLVSDTTPPWFIDNTPINQTLTYLTALEYEINATDNIGLDSFAVNDTSFRINKTGYLFNNTVLGAGIYYINISINDSGNNWNSTIMFVNITPKSQTATLNINQSSPIIYGEYINVTCNGQLYLEEANITNSIGTSVLLGAGSWDYSCKLLESQNYTYDDDNSTFVVNTASQGLTALLNSGTSNLTKTYPYPVNVSWSGTNQTEFKTFVNQLAITPHINYTYAVGAYVVNYSSLGNQNYSTFNNWLNFTIQIATPTLTLLINGSASNQTANQGVQTNVSAYIDNTEQTIALLNNSITATNSNHKFNTLANGTYNFTAYVVASQNYSYQTITRWSHIINITGGDTTPPTFTNLANLTHYVNTTFSRIWTATDSSGISCWKLNDTTKWNINCSGYMQNLTALDYLTTWWLNISVNDTLGNENSALFYINITRDNIPPNITLISPAEGTSSTTSAHNFTFNVSDSSNIENCSLILDSNIINFLSDVSKTQENGMYNSSLAVSTHSWSINCTDSLGNIGNSSSRTLTVIASSNLSTSPRGGSGGLNLSSGRILTISEKQFSGGYTQTLSKNDRIDINISNEWHSVRLVDVSSFQVTINVSSKPQQATMREGENKSFEVTNDNIYDLNVKINSINKTTLKSNITVKAIKEYIQSGGENQTDPISIPEITKEQELIEKRLTALERIRLGIIILAVIAAVIILVLYVIYKKKKKHYHLEDSLKTILKELPDIANNI